MGTPFDLTPGVFNLLKVPRHIRDYINEQGEGRSFNLESFSLRREVETHQVIVDLLIGPTGAEQLTPFTVSVVLGDAAAQQIAESLNVALGKTGERG
jgi:hypothetical protein